MREENVGAPIVVVNELSWKSVSVNETGPRCYQGVMSSSRARYEPVQIVLPHRAQPNMSFYNLNG